MSSVVIPPHAHSPPEVERRTFLFLSDIHRSFGDWEAKLRDKLNDRKVEYVISPGDFLDLSSAEQKDETVMEGAMEEFKSMLEQLKSMRRSRPRVYYVPGNHDPRCLFDNTLESKHLVDDALNAHNLVLKLEDGLYISGFGGSTPAMQGGNIKWEGYPFAGMDELGSALSSSLPGEIDRIPDEASLIFMTHTGPTSCSTTVDETREGGDVLMGNGDVRKLMESASVQARAIFAVHGHTHEGQGQGWVKGVRTVNPGSLKYGDFAVVSIERSPTANRWAVSACEFHTLT